jgi:SAM-dependent methyltransferase
MHPRGRFVLYRILGNDLPPRHGIGQTLSNLRFILEREPPLEGCEKRWVVNRIVDPAVESRITSLLDKHRARYLRIPFIDAEYRSCHFEFEGLPHIYHFYREEFQALDPIFKVKLVDWCYRRKNAYLTNVNGARNAALREGRTLAHWVLPFDGGCFFTAAGWSSIIKSEANAGSAKYLIVPMGRVMENETVLDPNYRPSDKDEPQIAFRHDASETFDDTLRYGTLSKTALLNRLGVPGWSQRARKLHWDKIDLTPSPETGRCVEAGWVVRLASGNPRADANRETRNFHQWASATRACVATEERIARRSLSANRLCFFDEAVLNQERRSWLAGKPALLDLVSSMCLLAAPTSEFELPGLPGGLPEQSRLKRLFDHVTVLALAWYFTREGRFASRAADLVRTWFITPATRLDPTAPDQMRTEPVHEETPDRIVETAGLVHVLDAIRLIFRSGMISGQDATALRAWFRAFLDWLRKSAEGRAAVSSAHHLGTCYDVCIAAVAIFLDQTSLFCHHLNVSRMRMVGQIRSDGTQPSESSQDRPLHPELLNLQMWANLARFARAAGVDLWNPETLEGRRLAQGVTAIAARASGAAADDASMDSVRARLQVLWAFVPEAVHKAGAPESDKYRLPACLRADAAVAPFWQLGLPGEPMGGVNGTTAGPDSVGTEDLAMTTDPAQESRQRHWSHRMENDAHTDAKPAPGMNRSIHRNAHGDLHHFCHPLVDPHWLPAEESTHMRPDDPVLGLEFDGRSWALPWWIMKNHHVANLVLNDRPVVVTLCEACSSGAAFDPVIDGRRHTFRLEGLYNGTIMPMDHETGTLWTGFTGEAIEGPLKGRIMERLPLLQCTWQEWLQLHPATLVPDGEGESRDGHGEGHSPGSPITEQAMIKLLPHIDPRLPHYALVLGVFVGGHSRCYPLSELEQQGPALNDTLGREEIAVFSRSGSWMASAYRRRIDGRCLSFRSEDDAIFDEQTGSRWEISGVATGGPMQGTQLKYVNSGVEEFFIWAAFHPETEIFRFETSGTGPARENQSGWSPATLSAISGIVLGKKGRATEGTWWPRGARLLDIGCGDGVIAAWFAESGLNVVGIDANPERIASARERFRGVVRLNLDVMDVRRPVRFSQTFDALVDHGCLAALPNIERATYVANVAAAANPGARFLLLLPALGGTDANRQLAQNVRRMFDGSFELLDARIAPFVRSATGAVVRGAAFRFVRR